ncbi:MAG: DNA internalization-related competence protein ComEC/Rec2 [Magnetococcales bacterium]|nr:DNA internalization-related competence protein ComEC/Rec2 [Magnetococcales bacterium]
MGGFLVWMIVGILAAWPVAGTPGWAPLVLAGTLASGVLWRQRRERWAKAAALGGLLTGMGGVLWEELRCPVPNLAWWGPQTREVIGVVADRDMRPDAVQLLLDRVTVGPERDPLPGLVRISLYRQAAAPWPGQRVRLWTRLREPRSYRVPGAFDYGRYLRLQGVVATGWAKGWQEVEGSPEGWLVNLVRARLAAWVAEVVSPEQVGLTQAMLVGKRGRLAREQQDVLKSTGLFHLVAISGLHLGLVAGWSFFLLRGLLVLTVPWARRWDMKRPAALLAIPPVFLYGALSGWGVATERAMVMVTVFLLAMALGRAHQTWRALGLAAILLLAWHPHQLLEAGFQLSFLAVAVLVLLGSWNRGRWQGWWGRLRGWLLLTAGVGLALLPVTAYHFHQTSPYGIIANPVAIPLVSLVSVPLGLVGLVTWPLSPDLAAGLIAAMGHSLGLLLHWAQWIDGWPGARHFVPGPPLAGLTLMVLAGVMAALGKGWPKWLVGGAMALGGWFWPHPALPPATLQVAILDVHQAQSVVVRMPGEGWSVLDAGGLSTPGFDTGQAVIAPYLWRHGVDHLRRVVVSHPQRDHMAGAAALLTLFPVDELWIGHFPAEESGREDFQHLLATAARRAVRVRRFQGSTVLPAGQGTWRVWAPLGPPAATNDRSLVVEAELGDHRFLMAGDIEKAGEAWLTAHAGLAPVTLLVAPHHGSASSSGPALVDRLRPAHVVFSVGADNPFGFPARQTLERWRATGARLWRTDRQGTITARSDGRSLTVTAVESPHADPPGDPAPR